MCLSGSYHPSVGPNPLLQIHGVPSGLCGWPVIPSSRRQKIHAAGCNPASTIGLVRPLCPHKYAQPTTCVWARMRRIGHRPFSLSVSRQPRGSAQQRVGTRQARDTMCSCTHTDCVSPQSQTQICLTSPSLCPFVLYYALCTANTSFSEVESGPPPRDVGSSRGDGGRFSKHCQTCRSAVVSTLAYLRFYQYKQKKSNPFHSHPFCSTAEPGWQPTGQDRARNQLRFNPFPLLRASTVGRTYLLPGWTWAWTK